MPLIRLVSHPDKNKYLCDKIVFIEGIPEHMMFYKKDGKNFLKHPWVIDVTENIPKPVRDKFQPQPLKTNVHFPSPEKGIPPINDEVDTYGFSLDYQNGQAEQIWESIERMIDAVTPRGDKLPVPILVDPSLDDEHRARGWTISAEDIPSIDLRGAQPAPVIVKPSGQPISMNKCPECPKSFAKEQGLRMHKMKAHKVPAGV